MVFLGQASNYSFGRALRHLFAHGNKHDAAHLKQKLAKRYGTNPDRVILYHTGRSALTAAFQALAPAGSTIIIPGLTCIAVVRAVRAAGCYPYFVDIDPQTLQYDWQQLEQALAAGIDGDQGSKDKKMELQSKTIDKKDNPCYNASIIVAQGTLGLPLEMSRLEKIAKQYHLKIVEDLAHSAGRFYPDGREVGTVGAAAALSFGKGKAIDTIEGGALVLRDSTAQRPSNPARPPKAGARWRDRWYPLLGNLIRAGYHVGLGKVITAICLKLHWIERSADAELNLEIGLTGWQAKLAAAQLDHLERTPLRDHRLVKQRSQLLEEFRRHGFYLDEIWYDTPVSPARYAAEADFPAERCPNTVRVAAEIINFPTWYSPERLKLAYQLALPYQIGGKND